MEPLVYVPTQTQLMAPPVPMEMHARLQINVKLALVVLAPLSLVQLPTNVTLLEPVTLKLEYALIQTKPMAPHAMMEMHARNPIHVKVESVLDLIL